MEHKKHLMEETSLTAFREIQNKLGERQEIVLNALTELCNLNGNATDQEIKQHLNKAEPNFVRPRRYELVNRFKLVGFSEKRVCRVTGKTSLSWKVLIKRLENV